MEQVVQWAFKWFFDQVNNMLNWVCQVLPPSPFQLLDMTPLHDYLPYINYFVPVDFILSCLAGWGVAIAAYYVYHVVLRWTKAIN